MSQARFQTNPQTKRLNRQVTKPAGNERLTANNAAQAVKGG